MGSLALAIILGLAFIGCSTLVPTHTPKEPGVRQNAVVIRIVDGDTIDVALGGVEKRVRLIGVDTPEVYGTLECFGPEASEYTSAFLEEGSPVILERDVSERDRYDRLLRYVYRRDGTMLNEVLVESGHAVVSTYPPDVRYESQFELAQQEARELKRGLWEACAPTVPQGAENLPYDPLGPDRGCGDFSTWAQAQAFYTASGGPTDDPHRLDGDSDGVPCESLPGSP
jgi:micrococcal nuclease